MITLTYRSDGRPVQSGQRLAIPHDWSHLPPHLVDVERVWPDGSGQPRHWVSGRLASSGETVMVIVWTSS